MFEIKRVCDEKPSPTPVPIVRAHTLAVTSLHRSREALAELLPPLPDSDAEEWPARLGRMFGFGREIMGDGLPAFTIVVGRLTQLGLNRLSAADGNTLPLGYASNKITRSCLVGVQNHQGVNPVTSIRSLRAGRPALNVSTRWLPFASQSAHLRSAFRAVLQPL